MDATRWRKAHRIVGLLDTSVRTVYDRLSDCYTDPYDFPSVSDGAAYLAFFQSVEVLKRGVVGWLVNNGDVPKPTKRGKPLDKEEVLAYLKYRDRVERESAINADDSITDELRSSMACFSKNPRCQSRENKL